MQCPHCGFENVNATAFCEQCGAPQNTVAITLEQEEYKAPSPPPLNGHKIPPSPSPPSLVYDQGAVPPYSYSPGNAHPGTRIFSAILYFIGIFITIFGLLGILTTFGSGNTIGLIGLLLSLIIVIISIIFLFRIRKRALNLRWWQRIVWIVGATLVAFLALILEVIAFPGGTITNYFTGTVILLYGLCCAAIAIW
ncbi:MAG TPA: zinc ribbon domain-containing protein [Ktedonobacteraceae bacterium]|nr:zinc ribbon domain-containing protein [Ktedonobacteraceae bacterium]